MPFVLLLACAAGPTPICETFPTDPMAADGVLTNDDTCGHWALAVDEHLYLSVYILSTETNCTAVMGEALTLNADPIYTDLSDEDPKWTFDFVGVAATGATPAQAEVECDDGTAWAALVTVE